MTTQTAAKVAAALLGMVEVLLTYLTPREQSAVLDKLDDFTFKRRKQIARDQVLLDKRRAGQ